MHSIEDHIEPAGLYIHVPFCVKKCPYCDFYSIEDHTLIQAYIEALLYEMFMVSDTSLLFDTIYFGGGTPSVLTSENISRIIEVANRTFQFQNNTEITLEVNPGTVTPGRLKGYGQAGVNRLNIGVQSFDERNLQFLGRIHSANEAVLAVELADREGFANIGLDLIYGVPGQTKESWLSDLRMAINLKPEHLSCYMLTYEPGTQMERDMLAHRFEQLDEGLSGALFKKTIDFLDSNGYFQYEVSNFARSVEGMSRHNRKYWSFVPYIGLGPSAHSFNNSVRYWNIRSVKKYIREANAGRQPVDAKEVLNRDQRIMEAIFLGLRQKEGITIDTFNKICEVDFIKIFGEVISDLKKKGFLKLSQNKCSLTKKGMLFLDSIVSIFVNQRFGPYPKK